MRFTRVDPRAAGVLVVDSDPLMLTAVGSVLDMQGYRASLARNLEVAVRALQQRPVDLMILAVGDLPQAQQFSKRLRSVTGASDVPILFLVPSMTAEWQPVLASLGGVYSILTPVDPHGLIDLVQSALWMPHLAHRQTAGPPPSHLAPQVADWVKLS